MALFGKKGAAKASAPKEPPKFVTKFNEIPPKKRALILVVILIVIGGLFVWQFYLPKTNQIKTLETQLEKLNKDLATAKKNAAEIDMIKAQVKEAEEKLSRDVKALPETEEIPLLLTTISKAGQEENLEFLLFEPQKEIMQDFYSEIPVKIEVVGEYHDIARFFSKVANLPRIVVIRNITMRPYTGTRKSQYTKPGFNLSVACIAATYKFVDVAQAPPPKKK